MIGSNFQPRLRRTRGTEERMRHFHHSSNVLALKRIEVEERLSMLNMLKEHRSLLMFIHRKTSHDGQEEEMVEEFFTQQSVAAPPASRRSI